MTCTDGVRSFEKTADTALVAFDVPDYGDWTVSALRNDLPSDSVTAEVDTAKQYPVILSFFVYTITVTVESGSIVVCEGGGRTQTQTSDGSVIFTVISAATYTLTATTGDETTSGTVEITASEQTKAITLEYFRSTQQSRSMSRRGLMSPVRTARLRLTAILTVLSCLRFTMRRRGGLPRP